MTKKKGIAITGILISALSCIAIIVTTFQITTNGLGNGASAIWDHDFQAFADELVINCKNDKEKVDTFRNWIIQNIQYDNEYNFGIYQHTSVSKIIETQKGVCYDYSNLFAALCRSQDIPCHIVDGTAKYDGYAHSWNRAYFNNCWYDVDLTNDAQVMQNKTGTMFGYRLSNGEDPDYNITKVY